MMMSIFIVVVVGGCWRWRCEHIRTYHLPSHHVGDCDPGLLRSIPSNRAVVLLVGKLR